MAYPIRGVCSARRRRSGFTNESRSLTKLVPRTVRTGYSTIQRFNDSTIQRFNDSTIQRFNDSTIQRFNDSTVQRSPCSRGQSSTKTEAMIQQAIINTKPLLNEPLL